MKTMFLWLRK